MDTDRTVTVYDKGITVPRADTYGEYVGVRSGDISIPRISSDEPLRLEVEEFAAAIRENRTPLSDGHSGVAVVEVLEGLQRSLDDGGRVITVEPVRA
jgi:predicted dehydrogenase